MSDTTDTTKKTDPRVCKGETCGGKTIQDGENFHHVDGADFCQECWNAIQRQEDAKDLKAGLEDRLGQPS